MCGIAGVYNPSCSISKSRLLLERMLSQIYYRGPDESGIYLHDRIALGSVRLSIIDIKTGQQPFQTPDKNYVIVFNGEIFNYIELKAELQKKGFSFITESDTEVLLYAYIAYGIECLNKLNGQFAFAIWNNITGDLFIARDRVGIRPLFYATVKDKLIFGSEIKVILEHPDVSASIDPIALSQVFTYWSTVTPKSIFENIFELSPGHYMIVASGKLTIKSYWSQNFPSDHHAYFKGTIDDAASELYTLLSDAVRIRLRADVPVAAYLSGGLDSSATTAFIKSINPNILQTFSIGFEDTEFDESAYQKEVSEYLNTDHTSFTCKREDIGNLFPQVIWHTEIPILRTAPVPMYCLSKKVRENNIKVVITGEGADEMFAGYDIFKEGIIREFWSKQPDSKLRPLLLNKLYPYLAQFQGKNKRLLKFFYGYNLQDTESPFYSHILRWRNASGIRNMFSAELIHSLKDSDIFSEVTNMLPLDFHKYDLLNKSQWLESVLFMSGYLLSSQGDRVSMANSVEGRYPFLDYRIIEYASLLPPAYKMHGLNEKFIIKKMMDGKLPLSVLKRPKQAYRAPIANSFMSSDSKDYVMDLTSDSEIKKTGLFNSDLVNKLVWKISGDDRATEMDNMALSGILSTQILYHQFIIKDRYRPTLKSLSNCRILSNNNAIFS